jgi:4-hydroxy-tetrahydrodipicolinate synthase
MAEQQGYASVVYSAVTTPFTAEGGVDTEAFREHLTWLRDTGLDGAVVCGTTGEFVAMDTDERLAALKVSMDVFGPEGTIAHIGAATLGQTLPILDRALDLGVKKFAAITPYYQPGEPQAVHDHYMCLAERARARGGSLLAYLFSARSATFVTPEQFGVIAKDAGLAGAKVSGESARTVLKYKAAFPRGLIVSGNDGELREYVVGGGDGGVAGISSAFPKPFVTMRDALRVGDLATAQAGQDQINQAIEALCGGAPRFLKAALDLRGLRGGITRVALDEPTPAQLRAIEKAIETIG